MDPSDPRPFQWIVYLRSYDPARAEYFDFPVSGHKTERDATASKFFRDEQLHRQQAAGELAVTDEYYWIAEKPPEQYETYARRRRTAERAFRRGANVLRVLAQLDLPLEQASFMIMPWPPSWLGPPAESDDEQT